MTPHLSQLVRVIFTSQNHIDEWRLGDSSRAAAKGLPGRYPCDVLDDYGIVFVDITLDAATGRPVCHEVNGPNGVGSDALTGESGARAENEARQAARRAREMGFLTDGGRLNRAVVAIHAHQHWSAFRTGTEFYPRVHRFAESVSRLLPDETLELRGASETLGVERIAVVVGDVPSVATSLDVDRATGRFRYQGRPVIFIGNPNLLPELVRTRKLPTAEPLQWRVDLRVFHSWRLTGVVLDKGRQQRFLEGTGIDPLPSFEAHSNHDALRLTRAMLAHGPVVLKPNGTSGGAGVHVAVPQMTDDEIGQRITAVLTDCIAKYGANFEAAAWPIRGFPFVRSTGYPLPDGDHLWDLRIAVMFEPGLAHAYPVSMRLAPAPFDRTAFHQNRDQWISNVSGRRETLLKSGMDDEALQIVGMSDAKLDLVMRASVAWTVRAWDASVRAGGPGGAVDEDEHERTDKDFYPAEKFCV